MCAGNTHPWETHIPVTPVPVPYFSVKQLVMDHVIMNNYSNKLQDIADTAGLYVKIDRGDDYYIQAYPGHIPVKFRMNKSLPIS